MNNTIIVSERLEALIKRRELSKAKRLASKRKRLYVNMDGFRGYYEEL